MGDLHGSARCVVVALLGHPVQDFVPLRRSRRRLGHHRLKKRKMRFMVPGRGLLGSHCDVKVLVC